jgi:simple sugar transport system substrate-binding protein
MVSSKSLLRVLRVAVAGLVVPLVTSMSGPAIAAAQDETCPDPNAKPMKVVMIFHVPWSDPNLAAAVNGANIAAKQFCADVSFQASNNDPLAESRLIDAAVAQKVDGIVVSLPAIDAETASIQAATQAGIPVWTINVGANDFQKTGAIGYAGQDEYIAGQGAGERLNQAGVTKVACIIHQAANSGLQDRCNGAKNTFSGTLVPVACEACDANPAQAVSTITATLAADPTIDGVLALNPLVGDYAVQAVQSANLGDKVKIGTFDVAGNVLNEIASGQLLFGVSQGIFEQGYVPIWGLYMDKTYNFIPNGGQAPILTGPTFVDKSNVDQWQALVAKQVW